MENQLMELLEHKRREQLDYIISQLSSACLATYVDDVIADVERIINEVSQMKEE